MAMNRDGVARIRKRWPVWGAVFAATLAAVAVAAGRWGGRQPPPPARLAGTVLDSPLPAEGFRLHDPEGRMVSLDEYRGRVVVLTFLYTHCPDACPLIAERIRRTYEQLGGARLQASFIAVSVDPRGDTPEAVTAFLAGHHLEGILRYLTGSGAELRRIWTQYRIRTEVETVTERAGSGVASRAPTGPPPTFVGHTARVYVIDPHGAIRAYLQAEFRPEDLAAFVRRFGIEEPR